MANDNGPVIYPDEEFDFPIEEDYDDTDVIGEPEKDDMVPVWPVGVAVPAPAVMSVEEIDAALKRLEGTHTIVGSVRWVDASNVSHTDDTCGCSMMFIPSSKSELDSFRESLKALPAGLKAVIYADLYNEGLRVTDVLSTDKKIGAAEKYIKEIES